MAQDRYYGPLLNGSAETIVGALTSSIVDIGPWADKYVKVTTPATYDRNLTFQVAFEDSLTTPVWFNAQYIDRSNVSAVPAIGAFAQAQNTTKLYKILDHGRRFSVVQSGGTTGNAAWQIICLPVAATGGSGSGGGTGSAASQVQGTVASGVTDANNPVKIGFKYNLALPTVTDGQRVDGQADANGREIVTLGTGLSGEDFTNGRFLVDQKPADADSVLETLQNAATTAVPGSSINLKGFKSLSLDVQITGTATVTFQATLDDTLWVTVGLAAYATGTIASTATATGSFYLPAGSPAFSQFRANITSVTPTPSVTVKSRKMPR